MAPPVPPSVPVKKLGGTYEGVDWATELILEPQPFCGFGMRLRKAAAAKGSELLRDQLAGSEDLAEVVVTVPTTTIEVVAIVVSFLDHHCEVAFSDPIPKPLTRELRELKVLSDFDQTLLFDTLAPDRKTGSYNQLFATLRVSRFLRAAQLTDILSAGVANSMRGKSVEFVRGMFGIEEKSKSDGARINA